MNKGLHLFSIGLLVLIPGLAYADEYGIALGKTCKTMLINNIPGCPSYEELDIVFPDNTDPRVGKLMDIDGIIQRGPSQFLHPEQFYRYFKGDLIWLDPPEDVRKRIKVITIEPSLPEYKIGAESRIMNDYNITFGKDRYINANCSEIKITAKNWLFMTWALAAPLRPIMEGWLGLPALAGLTLIVAVLRKELALQLLVTLAMAHYGPQASNLLSFMRPDQIVVYALVNTLYVPCVATISILGRELGWRRASLISVFTIVLALLVGGAARGILSLYR